MLTDPTWIPAQPSVPSVEPSLAAGVGLQPLFLPELPPFPTSSSPAILLLRLLLLLVLLLPTAALAPFNARLSPILEAPSAFPVTSPRPDPPLPLNKKLSSTRPRLPPHLLPFVLLFVIFLIQLFRQEPIQVERGWEPVTRYKGSPQSEPTSRNISIFSDLFAESQPHCKPNKMSVVEAAKRVASEFEYTSEDVNRGVEEFLSQMRDGLQKQGTTLSQIPTYVTAVPNGTEKGLYLAVDLGGTNFRVCSIQLNGDTTFSLTQSKVAVPQELMVAKQSKDLFAFLAKQIERFLQTHHNDHYQAHIERRKAGDHIRSTEVFQMGFTFSFPVNQHGINKGTLVRWTKGFDIPDTVGKDVCQILQQEIDALHLPVKVAALVNDTVGTLMARSYTSPGKTGTLLGAIFGTGTNGAYVEKLDRVTKLTSSSDAGVYDTTTGEMIINSEWGSFDNNLHILPNTPYDAALDAESNNPGVQMFEKRISGMFLGEILRRALLALVNDSKSQLFHDNTSADNDEHSTTYIREDSALYKKWGLDTSFLSICQADNSPGLRVIRLALSRDLGIDAASEEDAMAVKVLVEAIGRRAARLSAVAIGGVVVGTGNNKSKVGAGAEDDVVDIGVDGSLVEFYPGFEGYIREALREVKDLGEEGERRIRIGIAKDGSGVGAALIALVAEGMERRGSVVG